MEIPVDYSDGETSEDMMVRNVSNNNFSEFDDGMCFDNFGRVFETKYCENCYQLDINEYKEIDALFERVLIVISGVKNTMKTGSKYFEGKEMLFAWHKLSGCVNFDFYSSICNEYELIYKRVKKKIPIGSMISPKQEDFRKQIVAHKSGKTIFHYSSLKPIEDSRLYLRNNSNGQELFFQFHDILKYIGRPALFIIDCNNSGSIIEDICPENDNVIILCSTGANEYLPVDPYIPRDFLSSCMSQPCLIAVLCHIIQNYRMTYSDPSHFYQIIDEMVSNPDNEDIKLLEVLIKNIVISIPSDYMEPSLYSKAFQTEKLLSKCFCSFVLSQFLLFPFNIKPVSYPSIPFVHSHPMWSHLRNEIDSWVISSFSTHPLSGFNLYSGAIDSLAFLVDRNEQVPLSLLSLVLQIFFDNDGDKKECILTLMKYIDMKKANLNIISTVINFNMLFSYLYRDELDGYNLFCSFVFKLLSNNPNIISRVKSDFHYNGIMSLLLDTSKSAQTRSFLASIYSIVLYTIPNKRALMNNDNIFNHFNFALTLIDTFLVFHCLSLFSLAFSRVSIHLDFITSNSLHFRVSNHLYSKSPLSRYCASYSLSSLVQPNLLFINEMILVLAIPSFIDCFSKVRYGLLHLLYLNVLSDMKSFVFQSKQPRTTSSILVFSELLKEWYMNEYITFPVQKKLSVLGLSLDKMHNSEPSRQLSAVCMFLIDYFCHDPDISVQSFAKLIKSTILKKQNISEDNDGIKELIYQNDPLPILKYTILNHDIGFVEVPDDIHETAYPTISGEMLSFTKFAQSDKLDFKPIHLATDNYSLSTIVSGSNGWLYSFEENLSFNSKIKLDRFEISDLLCCRFNHRRYAVGSTNDGCSFIWSPSLPEEHESWRTDPNFLCDSIPQYSAINPSCNLFTSRGNAGIFRWDLSSLQLVSETNTHQNHIVTSLSLNPNNDNICISGYSNGELVCVDTRTSGVISKIDTKNRASIFKTCVSSNSLVISLSNGTCMSWDARNNALNTCFSKKERFISFDAHSSLGICAFSTKSSQITISNLDGETIYFLPCVSNTSSVKYHQSAPYIYVGGATGELFSYKFYK